ncbi:MAG: RHS repeat-associated core domain-containing protein, partial [Planctomycetota bacterium]
YKYLYDIGSAVPDKTIEYVYDNLGRKLQVIVDDVVEQDFDYDTDGRIITLTTPEGTINYDYNSITGRKTATWTGTNSASPVTKTEYSYDELGRLYDTTAAWRDATDITDEMTAYEYNEVGSRKSITLPNGGFAEYTYNSLNRLTDLVHYETSAKVNTLSSFDYSVNADGMRATADESVNENHYIDYTYDNLNRLESESNFDDSTPDNFGYTADYVCDLVGNRTQRIVTVTNSNGTHSVTTAYDYGTTNHTDRLMTETNTYSGVCAKLEFSGNKYVYAGLWDNKIGYLLPGKNKHIGQLMAFVLGLPSVWSKWLLWAALVLVPVVTFVPVVVQLYRRVSKSASGDTGIYLCLYKRCLCVLLSYVMLLSPVVLEALAQGTVEYANLCVSAWATSDSVSYTYDNNGSVTSKTSVKDSQTTQTVTYTYNLQNRLETVTTTPYTGGIPGTPSVTTYKYNPDGIRIEKDVDGTVTDYLIDPYNHTGYSQVLEETTGSSTITYTIGDDIIAQCATGGTPEYLLYDGHGSTRQLLNTDLTIADEYSYDGYGVMLGGNPTPSDSAATSLLYAGEQFDENLSQYYLRARYYNQNNGRFNRIDPFAGNNRDPQSLHKYLYVHANPINNVDPSGQMIGSIVDLANTISARAMMTWMSYGGTVLKALNTAMYVTGGLYAASSISLALIDWGYLPQNLQNYMEAIQFYSGIGFVMSLTALAIVSTLPDPRKTARPPQRIARLDRDKAVDGRAAPSLKPTSRPCAKNSFINAEKNRDVVRLRQQGVAQVRVNQRQIQYAGNGDFVQKGLNRPDTQGIFSNKPNV